MRIKKLLENININQVCYLTDPADMFYYSGFTGEGAVIIGHNERIIITDGRYKEQAENETSFEVKITLNHLDALKGLKKEMVLQKESVSFKKAEHFIKNGVKIADVDIDFDFLRSVKDDTEIECLKKAAEISELALNKLLSHIKKGKTEKELAALLGFFVRDFGGEKEAFDTILISGKNTSYPHGVPTDKKIESGDFVTIDFGTKYHGYCSDMTRTFAVEKATDEMVNIYNIVKDAQNIAESKIKEGIELKNVDGLARNVIDKNGFGNYFIHSTGHGVGLKIHETPNLSPKSSGKLLQNQVVTVEPGIYIPDKFGVRIENTVLVKKDKGIPLQKFKKELIIL